MSKRRSRSHFLSRRDFGILALYTVAAACSCGAGVSVFLWRGRRRAEALAAQRPEPSLTPSPLPSPTATTAPTAPTLTATPPGGLDPQVRAALLELQQNYLPQINTALVALRDPHARLVIHPLDAPDVAINLGGAVVHDSASIIKAIVLTYATFREPRIALTRWQREAGQNAYRMAVFSNNTATARVLAAAVLPDDLKDALNAYNDFHHHVMGLPKDTGLTRWEYGPTAGLTTDRVIVPPESATASRTANPISLDALVAFFRTLETPADLEGAITRTHELPNYPLYPHQFDSVEEYRAAIVEAVVEVRFLLGIPDPELPTEFEKMLERARQEYPELGFELYGKNGVISPGDWQAGRWQLSEAGVLTIRRGDLASRTILAYTSSTFHTNVLFDLALEYAVRLFRAQYG